MSVFLDFLEEVSSLFESTQQKVADSPSIPGIITICFVNRYLEPMGEIKYQIKFDGKTIVGETTPTQFKADIHPVTVNPVRVYVWSRRSDSFKLIDTITPLINKPKLVYEHMRSFKHSSKTHPHPKNEGMPPQSEPKSPKSAPGDSPTNNQGAHPEESKNKNDEPIHKATRPVPDKITVAQLRKIFPLAETDFLKIVADECNKDLVKYHLDSFYRRAHFFAQIRGETGARMRPVREDWEYSSDFLMTFSYYKKHPSEALADGYTRGPSVNGKRGKVIRHANQDAIGRKHFSKLNGNRSDHPEDGSDFRGRGLIQITGYEKYSTFMNEYSKYFSGAIPDAVKEPDIVNQTPYAIQSALWFWLWKKVYLQADKGNGYDDVEDVTYKINGGYIGLSKRRSAYRLAEAAFK